MPQSFAVDFALLLEINDRMLGQLIHILAMFVDHFLGFWPFARDKTNVAASGAESFCRFSRLPGCLAIWLYDCLAGSALHMYPSSSCGDRLQFFCVTTPNAFFNC